MVFWWSKNSVRAHFLWIKKEKKNFCFPSSQPHLLRKERRRRWMRLKVESWPNFLFFLVLRSWHALLLIFPPPRYAKAPRERDALYRKVAPKQPRFIVLSLHAHPHTKRLVKRAKKGDEGKVFFFLLFFRAPQTENCARVHSFKDIFLDCLAGRREGSITQRRLFIDDLSLVAVRAFSWPPFILIATDPRICMCYEGRRSLSPLSLKWLLHE